MQAFVAIQPPCIYPTFRYRNAAAIIDWLVEVIGFTERAKYMAGDAVAHAELALGSSIIMLGDVKPDAYGDMVGEPGAQGGKSVYVAVEDVDGLYRRAKRSGATILEEIHDRDHGSRDFICADAEGNVWCFGTYWPKAHEAG